MRPTDGITMSNNHKLCIILLSAFLLNYIAPCIPEAAAYISAQPLWGADHMNTSMCSFSQQNASVETFVLHGSALQTCSLQINASLGYYTQIEILQDINNALISLHIERVGDTVDCPKRYLSLIAKKGGNQSCQYSFNQRGIHLHVQGNVSIVVSGKPSASDPLHRCPERNSEIQVNHSSPIQDHHSNCQQQLKGYNSIVTCEGQIDDSRCRLQFPDICNATLGHGEVLFQCIDSNGLIRRQESLIFYPSVVISTLDLSNNNVILFATKVNSVEYVSASGLFQGMDRLTCLYLNDNMLTSLPFGLFRGLANLSKLYLYGNGLITFDAGAFKGLFRLQYFYLNNNRLLILPNGIFRGLVNLRVLYLSGNQLVALDGTIFQGLDKLKSLHLQDNDLTSLQEGLFSGMKDVVELLLKKNKLATLRGNTFHGLKQLVYISMSYNRLIMLPVELFEGLYNLEILSIRNNQLTTLSIGTFHGLGKLNVLILSSNNITALPVGLFTGLHNLTDLYLSYNQLASLDPGLFYSLTNLRVLLLGHVGSAKLTKLRNGVFDGLHTLQYLTLRSNQLHTLDEYIFKDLYNLRFLVLDNNNIAKLEFDVFKNIVSVTFVDLSTNRLSECPSLRNLTKLNFINLRNNTLKGITRESFSTISSTAEVYVNQHEVCECYVPAGVNCSAADDRSPYLTCDRLLSDRALVVVMWIFGINALVGNIFVMVWRGIKVEKVKVQDILLSNLAMSDSLMGIYMLIIACADIYYGEKFPLQSETWRSGITCRVAGALSIASSEASVFFITLISIDRCISIRFPLLSNKMGKQTTIVITGLIWVFSLALGIVPSVFAGQNFKFYDNSHVCIGLPLALTKTYSVEKYTTRVQPRNTHFYYDKTAFTTRFEGLATGLYFSTAIFLGLNCVCYLLILGCYIEIFRVVVKSSKDSGRARDMKEQIALTTKVMAIVATDFLCWFPIIVLGILVQTRVISLPPSVYAWCVTFVLPLNSAINPYLYTIADAFSSCRRKRDQANRPATSTSNVMNVTDSAGAGARNDP